MRLPFLSVIAVVTITVICIPTFADKKKSDMESAKIAVVKEIATNDVSKRVPAATDKTTNVLVESETEVTSYQSSYDFDSLKKDNADITAWIEVPGTNIDYPVLFDGTDRYLHMNLGKEDSVAGSIYVDATAENALKENINIIYGHHMKNGSMFADVDKFSTDVFWNEHQEINLYTQEYEVNLKPVLCVVGKSDISLRDIENIQSLSDFCNDKTITQGEIPEEWNDMYVLVTCNYTGNNYRTYLFCSK